MVSIPALAAATFLGSRHFGFDSWLPALAASGAFGAWLLTRPRMTRVFRRMRGEKIAEWTGYYDD